MRIRRLCAYSPYWWAHSRYGIEMSILPVDMDIMVPKITLAFDRVPPFQVKKHPRSRLLDAEKFKRTTA